MSFLIKKILLNHSTRVLVLLFVALLILIAYFLGHSYFVQLQIHKNKVTSTIEAVSNTAAAQLDANQLDYLLNKYPKKDGIKTNSEDGVYELLHDKLAKIKALNNIQTDIYTLSYNKGDNSFFFGVTSSDKPFFRHKYLDFPSELKDNYNEGSTIDVYGDENGHWISAFTPIYNNKGETIAVVQVDQPFDSFLEESRHEIFKNIGISLIFTFILLFFLIRSMRSILLKEDHLNAVLMQSKLELEEKNKETIDSIIYAKKIQDAILPIVSNIKKQLPESFVFFLPRDIVSGDFYWFKYTRNKIFIASVDCTGHGVPGAFMSMIGSVLLDDIVTKNKVDKPSEILKQLHDGVVKSLKQSHKSKAARDGMDIAMCVIDDDFKRLSFSGAFRPLILIKSGELVRVKSTSSPIGGIRDGKIIFENHVFDLQKDDQFYIYSDGYADQFSGLTNKKYMTKKFRNFLLKISPKPMEEQERLLREEFYSWKGDASQVDDVLVIGFKI